MSSDPYGKITSSGKLNLLCRTDIPEDLSRKIYELVTRIYEYIISIPEARCDLAITEFTRFFANASKDGNNIGLTLLSFDNIPYYKGEDSPIGRLLNNKLLTQLTRYDEDDYAICTQQVEAAIHSIPSPYSSTFAMKL